MQEINHKLAAIVFTDVVGYTRQMEQDEYRTMQLLQKQRDIVFPVVQSYRGEIVKELGDGLLMMFSSALEAVRCAIEIQTRLKDEELTIRAGIHIGEVIFKDGDVFGSAVNVAARIQPLASANGICISEDVKNQVQNKTDIRMNSIGIRELKGIKEPMEIFEILIEGVTTPKKKGIKYLINDLWSRQVIQAVAIYFIGAWLIKIAISSYVTGRLLSPHLVDLAWVILLSLIPSVFLLTYYHGKKRRMGKWAKAELIGFPLNVVLSILLIVFLFKGKDLGAATTSITIEDENGNKTERTILKNEFRKKTLIFFFENKSADTSLNWLQYAFPIMTEYDACQDIFLETQSALNSLPKLKEAGFKDGITDDLMLEKKLASDIHRGYFMTGDFDISAGKYIVGTKLYNSQTGKLIAENQFSDEDVFRIVDEITLQLKKDLGIPESHIEETVDMPVSEISTSSVKALEYYINGIIGIKANYRRDLSIDLVNKAIEEDKDFILAYASNLSLYQENNQMEQALATAQIIMDKLYKLPEGTQYFVRYLYYSLNNEPEKVLNLCLQWTKLYPDDIQAHQVLASVYFMRNEIENCIHENKAILSLDPEHLFSLEQLGHLFLISDNYDSAEYYYRQYSIAAPKDYKPYYDLAVLYMIMPDFIKASENFENALVLEPGNISIMLSNAAVYILQGAMEKAENIYKEALGSSKTAQDSASVYFAMEQYYHFKGEVLKSIEFFNRGMDKFSKYSSPFETAQMSDNIVENYIQCGKPEDAYRLLKISEEQLGPHFEKVTSFGYLFYYIEQGNADEAEKYIPEALQAINDFGIQIEMDEIFLARARIAEIREDYDTALYYHQKCLEMDASDWDALRSISRCQRKLGDFKKAKKNIELSLTHNPYDPKSNYEAAMLYLEMNDKEKAREYLQRTMEVWQNADTNYKPYKEALALRAKI